jgi:hypothetical protein
MEKVDSDLLDWKNILGVVPYRPRQLYTFFAPTGIQELVTSYNIMFMIKCSKFPYNLYSI